MSSVQLPRPPKADLVQPVTELWRSDFANGTYRITASGTYRVMEDINFRPNPNDDFRPLPSQAALYPTTGAEAAYRLGFFAAITVEAADVVLDLNNHVVQQSAIHALQQRFFAVIELADQPFIPAQGPADFGASIQAAQRVVIRNGTLGRSSHHGVHGNDNVDVRIENVYFANFEVAAVALNGVTRCLVTNCHVTGSRQDVPVLGTYSAARFLLPALGAVDDGATVRLRGARVTAATIKASLKAAMDKVVAGTATVAGPEGVFVNPTGSADGPAYGFLFHSRGLAVNSFACCSDLTGGTRATHVSVVNCVIENVKATPDEVVTLSKGGANRAPQTGLFGETVPIEQIADDRGKYVGTVLSDAHMLLAKHTAATQIAPALLAWAEADTPTLDAVRAASGFEFLLNGDSMFHVHKGVIGLRIDGANHVLVQNVDVCNMENHGLPGDARTAYYGPARGHLHQNEGMGYCGSEVRGLSVAGSLNVTLSRVRTMNVRSLHGPATGMDFMLSNDNVRASDLYVVDVHAATALVGPARSATPQLPNVKLVATGIDTRESKTVTLTRVHVCRLQGPSQNVFRSQSAKQTVGSCSSFDYFFDHATQRGRLQVRRV